MQVAIERVGFDENNGRGSIQLTDFCESASAVSCVPAQPLLNAINMPSNSLPHRSRAVPSTSAVTSTPLYSATSAFLTGTPPPTHLNSPLLLPAPSTPPHPNRPLLPLSVRSTHFPCPDSPLFSPPPTVAVPSSPFTFRSPFRPPLPASPSPLPLSRILQAAFPSNGDSAAISATLHPTSSTSITIPMATGSNPASRTDRRHATETKKGVCSECRRFNGGWKYHKRSAHQMTMVLQLGGHTLTLHHNENSCFVCPICLGEKKDPEKLKASWSLQFFLFLCMDTHCFYIRNMPRSVSIW